MKCESIVNFWECEMVILWGGGMRTKNENENKNEKWIGISTPSEN